VARTIQDLIIGLKAGELPTVEELSQLLAVRGDDSRLLLQAADSVRSAAMGDAVHIRGIIEFSNICRNDCLYCGIRRSNKAVTRYRIPDEEILETAVHAKEWGCGTVVLQSGEDPYYTAERISKLVCAIHAMDLAITLSLGVRPCAELQAFREAGADRYLLRFETSNREHFARLHPDAPFEDRIRCLSNLRELGFQVGSGFMIGLPDATLEDIARDLLFTRQLQLDMIGCGPFLAHPDTPLRDYEQLPEKSVYYHVIALLRLLNPHAHIPATTAFDALDKESGRNRVLEGGANVFMPNLTPGKYRKQYLLYPNKPCVDEEGGACMLCIRGRLRSLGREIATGRGDAWRLTNAERSNA